ncbi:MAG TPA: TIGR00266 family protein [Candidatus Sulfomarinibacteraceae bacterium]|nr:TIGR00266 family protein [Candidatus Sulfomarinibacteraceae bacterium]
MSKQWYVAVNGESFGPFGEDELRQKFAAGTYNRDHHVYTEGMRGWIPAHAVDELEGLFGPVPAPPPAPRPGSIADEIDYEIHGAEMQFVEIELDPGESVVAEAGGMMYMGRGIEMQTIFGDGSGQQGGFMDKLVGAGKRLLTGESLFMTVFTHKGSGKARIAFASPYPGKIIPVDLARAGGKLICQKDAFLCAAKGVQVGIAFQKKIGTGLFGGEGFIMQKLEGDGLAFVHAGGTILERELAPGEDLRVDTGCLVALEPSVSYDVELVGGVKSAIFGGEGFFFARLAGPGKVWLQSLPFSRLAGRIWQNAPQAGSKGRGEGSVLGQLGGIGGFFDGN